MGLILLLIVLFLLLGAAPTWPYARDWGYGPSGFFGALLLVLLILLLLGWLPWGWGPNVVIR